MKYSNKSYTISEVLLGKHWIKSLVIVVIIFRLFPTKECGRNQHAKPLNKEEIVVSFLKLLKPSTKFEQIVMLVLGIYLHLNS